MNMPHIIQQKQFLSTYCAGDAMLISGNLYMDQICCVIKVSFD